MVVNWAGLSVLAVVGVVGCTRPAKFDSRSATPASIASDAAVLFGASRESADELSEIRVHLQFDVSRIELPAGSIRHSAKVWNHVDEMQVDPVLSARLSRNGLRIGVARASAWPALRAIFTEENARIARIQRVAQPGAPLWLGLDRITNDEPIFYYGTDGRLAGKTFDGGTKCLRIDYEMIAATDLQVVLSVTPEIQDEESTVQWRRSSEGYYLSSENKRYVFNELRSTWTLGPGDFLVIGPDARTPAGQLIGSRLLTRRTGGEELDMILCITPVPFRLK